MSMSKTPKTDEVLAIENNFGFQPPDDGVTAEEAHYAMVKALTNLSKELEAELAEARMMLNDVSYDLMHNKYAEDNEWQLELEKKIDDYLSATKVPGNRV